MREEKRGRASDQFMTRVPKNCAYFLGLIPIPMLKMILNLDTYLERIKERGRGSERENICVFSSHSAFHKCPSLHEFLAVESYEGTS